MSNVTYTHFKEALFEGLVNPSNADYWVLLVNGYTPSQDIEQYVSDISTFETSGSGYVRKELTGLMSAYDTINHRIVLDADDVTWQLANFTANGAIIYIKDTSDATSRLVSFVDFNIAKSSSNTNFVIKWSDAEKFMNIR